MLGLLRGREWNMMEMIIIDNRSLSASCMLDPDDHIMRKILIRHVLSSIKYIESNIFSPRILQLKQAT